MADLTYDIVARLFKPDFETGKLYWRERTTEWFQPGAHGAEVYSGMWNKRYANTEAFTSDNGYGYRTGHIFRRPYQAHRVIWMLAHKEWPKNQIDHINGIRSDNRLINLRPVSHAENGRNQKLRSTNTSGVMGVYWHKSAKKWGARIKVGGSYRYLGLFFEFADAVSARRHAEALYDFHGGHGRL